MAILNNFGAMAPDLVERSMQRFAHDVMPAVTRRLGMKKAAE